MKGPHEELVVLDTNVLVPLARNSTMGQQIEEHYAFTQRPERPLLCSVVAGEILGLARQGNWGDTKMDALRTLLSQLVWVDAGMPEIVEAYAELYVVARANGRAHLQNDLWIAATAKVAGATVYTCDRD